MAEDFAPTMQKENLSSTAEQKKSEETRLRTVVPGEKSKTETPESKPRKKRKPVPVQVYQYNQPPNPLARIPVMMADGKTPQEWMSTAEADAWCDENIKKAGRYVIVTVQRDFEITVKQETVVTRIP